MKTITFEFSISIMVRVYGSGLFCTQDRPNNVFELPLALV